LGGTESQAGDTNKSHSGLVVEETVNRILLAVKHITLAVDKLRELRGARIYSLAVGWKVNYHLLFYADVK